MIPLRRFVLALAGGLLLVPFAATAASADQAEAPSPQTSAPAPEAEREDTAKDDSAEANKRVCKSVRADPSSRRKTRVCRTMEEWRKLNVPM